MRSLVDQTESFLHRAGYTLATVDGRVEGAFVVLTINEGLLEKVVFRGRLTFQMIRLKLALELPHEVFNKPYLEQRLSDLSKQLNIDPPDFELMPTQLVQHVGPQVDSLGPLGTIQGATLMRPQQEYELHVFFAERDWSTGPGLDIRVSYFDGLELGINYQGKSLLFDDDRWRVALMGGAGVRQAIPNKAYYVYPSRIFAEAQYFTPAIARIVRTFLWLDSEALARQRADLGFENYYSTDTQISANIQVQPQEAVNIFIGFGVQHFSIFGERAPAGSPAIDSVFDQRWRGFVRLGLDLVFDNGNDRWDRRHALSVEARLWSNFAQLDKVNFTQVRLSYQKVVTFGWNDLILRANGTWLAGDVLFPFEQPLGENLHGVFGDVFVRTAGGGHGEFRLSLTRDLYKVGAFVEVAGYGQLDRVTGKQLPRFGTAFGPSFHALVEGMFQMDIAVSFGLLSTGRFNTGLYATLIKVF
jgi:hypothetical protein